MTHAQINRRALLAAASAGVGLAFAGRVAAQASGPRNKMVVVIARGAMDGLSVTVPYADANYVPLRGGLAMAAPGEAGGALDLAEGFGLHPALSGLHGLYGQGQLRFAPAVALPVRIRSHFDAQDVLLAGGALKAGGPIGDWPTLADNRLFENRDLAPTLDIRSVFKGVLRDHVGVDRAALDDRVFPGSAGEAPTLDGLV